MANQKHLKILRKGVKEWNEWRKQKPSIKPDLSEANLSKLDLGNADFSKTNLRRAMLMETNLFEVNPHGNANLCGADLRDAQLEGATLTKAFCRDADFRRANLSGAHLDEVDFQGAKISGANLHGAFLFAANLRGADLKRAGLVNADLTVANLVDVDARGVDLSGANLRGAQLNGANLTNSMMGDTSLDDIDLSCVKGLETVEHDQPSTIGIDTIYQSKGQIPEVFLRGAGVPEPFIVQMKALVAAMEPIQFYSCFISYSSKDGEFAQRLHADLQQKNVRCWFAPEDMKIGDRIRPRIDEAIRMYDKLLLVLTESSMKSAWVEKEVETAFEKERKLGRTVLFPIRLDDAVMEAKEAWAADIRRTRHIGDFCGWKDHDNYKKAFDRLMRNLKAEVSPDGKVHQAGNPNG